MALIGRLFVIFFGFLAACFVAGMIVVVAVLYPEFSDLGSGTIDQSAINVVLGFGFIFLSGFALLPALIVVLITEAFYVRGVLSLCGRRRDRGLRLLSRPGPVRSRDAAFRRHRAPASRDHDGGGHRRRPRLLDDRRPHCRCMARAAATPTAAAAAAGAITAAAVTSSHPPSPRLNPAP